MPNLSVDISGGGALVADSLAITGAITAGSVTTTGDIQGAIVRGTTALEYPAHATLPTVRCTTDTGVGLGRTASATLKAFGSTAILLPSPVTVTGTLTMDGDLNMQAGRKLALDTSTSQASCALQFRGDPDTGVFYVSNNNFAISSNAIQRVAFNTAGLTVLNGAMYFEEIAAAPGAVANYSILYSLDVAGKTQLDAKQGGAGTVTQLAIEV